MASYFKKGKSFAVAFDGRLSGLPKGRRDFIYGLKSEGMARRSAAKKTEEEQLFRAGLYRPDPHTAKHRAAEAVDIGEHVAAFGRSLKAKGDCRDHYIGQESHVRRLLRLAKVTRVSGLNAEGIQAAAAQLLADGLSPRTVNAALKAARQFSTWLVATHRAHADALHGRLSLFNEALDVRRRRRELTIGEIAWLLDTTEKSRRRRAGLSGVDRALLYATGIGTGFRQRGLLGLDKSCFRVSATLMRPSIVLPAKLNKSGEDFVQRIRRDLAAKLRAWLQHKPDTGPVWRPYPWAKPSAMFRRDMEAARAAWIADGGDASDKSFLAYEYDDGRGKVFADFHGLRHTGISRVVRETRNLRIGQVWAGHSTPVLTARYAHLDLIDEDMALDALPAADLKPQRKGKARKRPG